MRGLIGFRVQDDAEAAQEREIGMVAGQGKDLRGRDGLLPFRSADSHAAGLEAQHVGLEEGFHLFGLDAVFDVRANPILDGGAEFGAAMNQGYVGAGAIQIERGFGGRILAADDDDVLAPVGVRLGVVVRNVGQILAGNAEAIGQIVVAGGDDQAAGGVLMREYRFRSACGP